MNISNSYGAFAIALSIILGLICSVNTYKFLQSRKLRAVQIRKPRLTCSYCICGAIPTLLIIAPFKTYLDVFWVNQNDFTQSTRFHFEWWLFSLLEKLFICCMLVVLSLRCWLLYYDNMYAISLIDRKWKGLINPHDQDFWMKHKKTLGDAGFLALSGVLITNILLIILCVLSMNAFRTGKLTLLNAVILFFIAIPCCLFICGLVLYGKHTKVFSLEADKFELIREMQYIAASTLFVVVIYAVDLGDIYLHHRWSLATETANIVFAFLTSWIQNRWILKQHHNPDKNTDFLEKELAPAMHDNISVASASGVSPDTELTMMDVLRDKYGFTMFMRHCLSELSVEGLLFIVEVAQYKAKLAKDKKIPCIPESEHERRRSLVHRHRNTDDDEHAAERNLPSLKQIKRKDKKKKAKHHKFEDAVLSKNWIPAADHLFVHDAYHLNHEHVTLQLAPISEENQTEEKHEEEPATTPRMADTGTPSTSSSDSVNMDLQWMYDYANYLFLKYVDVEAEFTVNVSFEARQSLLLFFSNQMEEAFDIVLRERGVDGSAVDEAAYLMLAKDCLLHVFDDAVAEVWTMLAYSAFLRFRNTAQFKHLCESSKLAKK